MAKQELGELYYKITADTKGLDKGLNTSDKKVGGLGKSFSGLGSLIKGGFAVAAVAGIAKVSKELIDAASKAEETNNKFKVTFRGIGNEARETADSLADSFGLSQQAAEDLLANTGDLLTGFGFTKDAALGLSEQVNTLAGDLSSFQNVDIKVASDAITKALLGEREALKSLGIAITEADLKRLAEDKGITGELDRQTKAALTFELALSQSGNAIGDFARSADSYANRMRVAQGATADLAAELGRFLLPAASASVGIFGQLTRAIADYVKERNDAKAAEKAGETGIGDLNAAYEYQQSQLKILREAIEENNRLGTEGAKIQNGLLSQEREERQKILLRLASQITAQDRLANAQKKARDSLMELAEEEAALALERKRRDAIAIDATAELANRQIDALPTKEREIALLQQQIDKWAELRDIPGVQALLNDLVKEQTVLIDELNTVIENSTELTYEQTLALREQAAIEESLWQQAIQAAKDRAAAEGEAADSIIADQKRIQQAYISGAGIIGDFYGSISQIQTNLGNAELQRLQAEIDATEEGTEARTAAEERYAAKKKQFAIEDANRQKGLAIFSATISTAQAIIGFLANPGGFAGVALSIAAGIAGAAQIAAISSQPPPAFEQGGIVPIVPGASPTGDNQLIAVNGGETITPAGQGGSLQLYIMLDGEQIAESTINNYVNKRRITIIPEAIR